MENIEKSKSNGIWKIIALILIGVFIGIFVGTRLISAFDWNGVGLNKTETCNLFNKTGVMCETFWCENVNSGNYSLTKEVCIIYNQSNYNYTNYSCNFSLNESNVLEIIRNYTLNNSTFFENLTLKGYIDSQTMALRDSMLDTQENRTIEILRREYPKNTNNYAQTTTPMPVWIWVVAIFFVCLLVAFLVWNNNKVKSEKAYDEDRDRVYSNKKSFIPKEKYISKNYSKVKQDRMRNEDIEDKKKEDYEKLDGDGEDLYDESDNGGVK